MKTKNLLSKICILIIIAAVCALMQLFEISCFIKELFGIACPGCGMTRALISALRFNPITAFKYHPMFWSVPILLLYFLFDGKLINNRYADGIILSLILLGFISVWILRSVGIIPQV